MKNFITNLGIIFAEQKFTYHSESEHVLDNLINDVEKKKLSENLASDLKKIKTAV